MIVELIKPDIDKNKLARLLGGRTVRCLSHATGKRLEIWNEKMTDIVNSRLMYTMCRIKLSNGSLLLENGLRLNSPKAAKVLHGCTDMVCFLATIGRGIEKEIIRLTAGKRSSDAYVLDSLGSVAVENIVERFHNRMKKKMNSESRAVTMRMSPGYCDWPLQEQKKIFSLLDFERIGVDLTDSCLMQPRKSISGIFGILPLALSREAAAYNPCSDCQKVNCMARRAEFVDEEKKLVAC